MNQQLSKIEVATMLDRSKRTVERLVRSKKLGGPIRDTKPAKWKITTVHKYMKANGIPIPPSSATKADVKRAARAEG